MSSERAAPSPRRYRRPTAEHVFAVLLLLYPRRFRTAFAPELMDFFRQDRSRATRSGRGARVRFWWITVVDLGRSALRQRFGGGASFQQPPSPRHSRIMSGLIFDLRAAARSLRRSPAFFGIALITLALGIGATTAILSVVDGVMVRPLPYPESGRLVGVGTVFPHDPDGLGPLAPGHVHDLGQLQSLDAFVVSDEVSMTLLGEGEPERIEVARVTEGFFELFGVPLAAGRGLTRADYEAVAARVAVLEHGFARSRWANPDAAIGEPMTLNGEAYEIVGVAGPEFRRPEAVWSLRDAQMWVAWPVDQIDETNYHNFGYQTVARLAPGATVESASQEVDTRFRQSSVEYNPEYALGGHVMPLHEVTLGSIGEPLRLLLMAAAFLLLIACANVANLMLARGTARAREIAVRTALGAGRGRIARQLLTESVVLALLAGMLGALAAYWSIEVFKAANPGGVPRLAEVVVDLRILGVSLALSTITGALFGLAPVFQAGNADASSELKESGSSLTAGRRRGALRAGLVVGEVALALMLLVGAGLLVSSFVNLARVDAGFAPRGLISMRVDLRSAYPERESWAPFFMQVLEQVRAIPGLESASLTTSLPYSGIFAMRTLTPIDGATTEETFVPVTVVTPGHFRNMGMSLLEGRDFSAGDRADGARVAIVNEAFVDEFWPAAESPVGKHVKLGALDDEEEPTVLVVGMVNSLRYRPDQPQHSEIYFPIAQDELKSMTVVARTADDPAALASALRQSIWNVDPDLPIDRVAVVTDLASASVVRPRFYSLLAASFAAVALALALVGIYGTISYATVRRTREIGVRVALGADRRKVVGLVIGSGMRPVALGIALGVGGAIALTRLLEGFLFGVTATDPFTFAAVVALFITTAVTANYFPARRAARLDPVLSLRTDI